jgi:hypothetical protein
VPIPENLLNHELKMVLHENLAIKKIQHFKKKSCDESQGTQYFFLNRHTGHPRGNLKRDPQEELIFHRKLNLTITVTNTYFSAEMRLD